MKQAIQFLKCIGIKCDKNGNVLSPLPDGEEGIYLIDMIEENTTNKENDFKDKNFCYTIINNKLEKIEC